MRRMAIALLAAAALALGASDAAAQTQGARPGQPAGPAPASYRLVQTIDLPGAKGGASGEVALDLDTGTLWVAQASNRSVVVIETESNRVRQVIEGVERGSGIGFSEHYAFVSDAASNAVVVIGKRSLEKAADLRASGAEPDGVYFDAKHGEVWVTAGTGDMTIFKAVGRGGFKRLAGLKLKSGPAGAAPGVGLYLAAKDRLFQPVDDGIEVINPASRHIEHSWKVSGAGRIASVAYDAKTDRLVAATSSRGVLVLDAKSGKVAAQVALQGRLQAVAVDSALRRAYVADRAGTVDVIELDRGVLLAAIPSEPEAHSLTVDPRTHLLYVYREQGNQVDVLAPQ